jgi:hypothetical protein
MAPALLSRPASFEQPAVPVGGKGIEAAAVTANITRGINTVPPMTPTIAGTADETPRLADRAPVASVVSWAVNASTTATSLPADRMLAGAGEAVGTDARGGLAEIPQTEEGQLPAPLPAGDGQGVSSAATFSSTLLLASRVDPRSNVGRDAGEAAPQGVSEGAARPVLVEAPVPPAGWDHEWIVVPIPLGPALDTEQTPVADITLPRPTSGALAVFALGAIVSGVAAHWREPANAERDVVARTRSRRLSI